MDRAQKQITIDSLGSALSAAGVVVTHNLGLTVSALAGLRDRLRAEGSNFRIVKNTLAVKALEDSPRASAAGLFTGPVGIAYGPDAAASARIVTQFAKENDRLTIVGGYMGETLLDPAGVKTLAELPPLDHLRSSLIGLIQEPASRLARLLDLHSQTEETNHVEA